MARLAEENLAVDNKPRPHFCKPKPFFSGRTTNKDKSEQKLNLMTRKLSCPEMSLSYISHDTEQCPIYITVYLQ